MPENVNRLSRVTGKLEICVSRGSRGRAEAGFGGASLREIRSAAVQSRNWYRLWLLFSRGDTAGRGWFDSIYLGRSLGF